MKTKYLIPAFVVAGLILAASTIPTTSAPMVAAPTQTPVPTKVPQPTPDLVAALDYGPEFHTYGSQVRLIGGYGDNLDYGGKNVQVGIGAADLHLDADADTGSIVAHFTVDRFNPSKDIDLENATVTLVFPAFGFPTGVDMPKYMEGGIADNVLLYGDSGNETPIMPKVRSAVASWGPVLVYVNGEQLKGGETLMGMPNPQGAFLGHMMLTDVVRDPTTQKVLNASGNALYNPKDPSNGSVVSDDISLLHLIVRSEEEDPSNSPGFDFYLNLNYEVTGMAPSAYISDLTYADIAKRGFDLPQIVMVELVTSPPAWQLEPLPRPCTDCGGDCDGDGHEGIRCGGDDCDDHDRKRFPGNVEICDSEGHDEDCDSATLGNKEDRDRDHDSFVSDQCCNTLPDRSLLCGEDCDDSMQGINPGQLEICNQIDDNCNGEVDEGVSMTAYRDDDGDLFGNPAISDQMCPYQVSGGWVANNTDCDDADPTVNPINGNCSD